MIKLLKQTFPLLAIGFGSLPQRKGSSSVIVVGIAGVVAVLVSILAVASGLERTLQGNVRNDVAVLLSAQAQSESSSVVPHEASDAVAGLGEVMRDAAGKPMVSPEVLTIFPVRSVSGSEDNVSLRGIGSQGFALHPNLRLTDGAWFHPGVREVVVGAGVAARYKGFAIGDEIRILNTVWKVAGHFQSGDAHDSEVIADAGTVQSAVDMNGFYSAIYVQLQSAGQLQAFKDEIAANPALHLDASTEAQYYASQSQSMTGTLITAAYLVSAIMAIGALFGAIHSLYISADERKIEMATLCALGFSSASVMLAFLAEALLLALAGGGVGAGLAWLLFNGHTLSTVGGEASQVVFKLQVAPGLVGTGLAWACAIGLIGAIAPCIRTLRLPVAEALRR